VGIKKEGRGQVGKEEGSGGDKNLKRCLQKKKEYLKERGKIGWAGKTKGKKRQWGGGIYLVTQIGIVKEVGVPR